ncbi:ComF family protein [Candidatus Saccharibacteria bacterium]|nr:ComF family protein [Candidatus Saccharibacteria bacterium]
MPIIVKNTTILNPLDLLAPHSCRGCGLIGKPLCDRCKKYIITNHKNYCPNCKSKNPTGKCQKCKNLPPIFVVGERSSLIGKLIHDYKYDSTRALALPLAEILNQIFPEIPGNVSIVPLPTISKHIRSRAFDHTLLLAKKLAKFRGKNYKVEKILIRSKNTVQVGTNEKTRIAQAASAYELAKNTILNPETTYLLLDDVWTTGASMKAALKKLRKAGALKTIILILAVNRLN